MPKKSKRKEIDPKDVSLGQLILLNRREELREQNEKNWKKSGTYSREVAFFDLLGD